MTKHRRLILLRAALISLAICSGILALALVLRRPGTQRSPRAQDDPAAVVAREYVTAKEGWPASAYTVENTHARDDEGHLIVNVVHKDDLNSLTVGGGKSLELHIDVEKWRVAKVLHFQ